MRTRHALALLSTAVIALTPVGAHASTATAVGTPVVNLCTASTISVSVGHTGVAGGNEAYTLLFTADWTEPIACALVGYPTVSYLTSSGASVAAEETMSGYIGGDTVDTVPPIVMMGPGSTASAIVEYSTSNGEPCYPLSGQSAQVDVTLQGRSGTTATTVLPANSYTDTVPCANLQVHPIVPGTTGDKTS